MRAITEVFNNGGQSSSARARPEEGEKRMVRELGQSGSSGIGVQVADSNAGTRSIMGMHGPHNLHTNDASFFLKPQHKENDSEQLSVTLRTKYCVCEMYLEILHWLFKFDGICGVNEEPKFRFSGALDRLCVYV
ncbi:PREDICTED: uncharacterized protein LOC106740665 [Dinoponera quadriceps]|uniref:Uncharacterized protein LOC106740665 n=1 Tax=Dinoponera quadriceps TaxID=609295 RepID=A0A6P3WNR1_DINQU|nr:PREDICTED: uncharacterized protein LOC106740665 [Dinoponera quadriceps]